MFAQKLSLPVRINGERIRLRDFTTADWIAVQEYAGDSDVTHFMSWGPNTPEETLSFVVSAAASAERVPRRRFDLAITLLETGQVIGGCGLYMQAQRSFEVEMGYCLRRDCWGRGYATEAAGLLLTLAFRELRLHRVIATCDPQNLASARVLEKSGLRREGLMRGHMRRGGEWSDSYLYGIIDSDAEAAAIVACSRGVVHEPS